MKRGVCASLILFAAAVAIAQPGIRIVQRTIDVGNGRTMWMQSAGHAGPTVVLETGFGDSHESWDRLFSRIAKSTRVISYDRAGIGNSTKSADPRSYEAVVNDLHKMLQAAGEKAPYVLVGHSYGGALIRAFAHFYPNEVAGLVFVDPMCEDAFLAVPEAERKAYEAEDAANEANWSPGQKGEGDFLISEEDHNFPILRSYGKPLDVPMVLLVAGRGRPTNWAKSVLGQYGSWMTELSETAINYYSNSRHYMMSDEPEAVIEAIDRVVFPDALRDLRRFSKTATVDETLTRFRAMKKRWPKERMKESVLNALGYDRIRASDPAGAIKFFEMNISLYPKSANAYDSLGEGYMVAGMKDLAIKNYKRSLSLDPNNANAQRKLKELGAAS